MTDRFTDLLSSYLDHDLPRGETDAVERHLAGRAECRDTIIETMPAELQSEAAPAPAPVAAEAIETIAVAADAGADGAPSSAWNRVITPLDASVRLALPPTDADSRTLADAIAEATRRIQLDGAEPALADELAALCERADRVLLHRHHLVEQLGMLCEELT